MSKSHIHFCFHVYTCSFYYHNFFLQQKQQNFGSNCRRVTANLWLFLHGVLWSLSFTSLYRSIWKREKANDSHRTTDYKYLTKFISPLSYVDWISFMLFFPSWSTFHQCINIILFLSRFPSPLLAFMFFFFLKKKTRRNTVLPECSHIRSVDKR